MKFYFRTTLLVLMVCLTVAFPSHAQTYESYSGAGCNVVDAAGYRQGYWKLVAGMLKLGSPWTPDQIVQEGNYTNSKPEGVWVTYNPYGKKVGEVSYKKGRRDGPCNYFSEAGKLVSSSTYVNGKREGLMTTYYPDGKVWMEYHWSGGEIVGNMKTYYPSGKLYEDGTWANGWFIGDYKIFNEDGTLKREALPPVTQ